MRHQAPTKLLTGPTSPTALVVRAWESSRLYLSKEGITHANTGDLTMFSNARNSRPSRRHSARKNQSIRNRLKNNPRFRRLRHEPLEDRRLLTGITYADFSDATGLNLISRADITTENILRLTPAEQGDVRGALVHRAPDPQAEEPKNDP